MFNAFNFRYLAWLSPHSLPEDQRSEELDIDIPWVFSVHADEKRMRCNPYDLSPAPYHSALAASNAATSPSPAERKQLRSRDWA